MDIGAIQMPLLLFFIIKTKMAATISRCLEYLDHISRSSLDFFTMLVFYMHVFGDVLSSGTLTVGQRGQGHM